MAERRARLIVRYERGMDRAVLRGALCLTPPPRYAELKRLVPGRALVEHRALLASWGVPWPAPAGWRDTLILRALRRADMVARRG